MAFRPDQVAVPAVEAPAPPAGAGTGSLHRRHRNQMRGGNVHASRPAEDQSGAPTRDKSAQDDLALERAEITVAAKPAARAVKVQRLSGLKHMTE